MIRDVTDLEVYNLSLELLEKVYKITNLLPYDRKRLKYQTTDAAEKIAPQIAEGFGKKRFPKEFCRFLAMALGSSDEVITHAREIIIYSKIFTRISTNECELLITDYKILSRKINKLLSIWQLYN